MKKIPVNIITGFLGAGKTTAIGNLLKNKPESENWAVIINEFGEISIDSFTLKDSASNMQGIYEVAGGCICCSSSDRFEESLDLIIRTEKPDRILIEPTGLGGTDSIRNLVQQKEALDCKAVICLVDVNGVDNTRLKINPIYLSQIRQSDIILLSKCDTNGAEQKSALLKEWISNEFEGETQCVNTFNGIIDSELLDKSKIESELIKSEFSFADVKGLSKDQSYQSATLTFNKKIVFQKEKVIDLIGKTKEVIRAKGFFNAGDYWFTFQKVMDSVSVEECQSKSENMYFAIAESGNAQCLPKLDKQIQNCQIH